ncbi:hypothetical protein CKM354_000621300 [Cercospora kikuchii]|uniref:Major facilitator superfamily (MFS) profile domain-containing protein n=1 Tax=Cercospora kikuchii TaxID=84275 RepID=A0A9P3CIZ1_9PEZI|nr:uncharacterized protein CKM354_000621300 [Cercospora kikuchii]GIZ42966.1 hypothetical protein CKM354_000621300 [Cercospora kikuchii]
MTRNDARVAPAASSATRSSTANSSAPKSIHFKTSSASSRTSNMSMSLPEESHPALPSDSWKKRSMKRSSYDFGHITARLSQAETSHLQQDAKRHSRGMSAPTGGSMTSPTQRDFLEPGAPPPPPIGRSYESLKAEQSMNENASKQHDIHAELHWEIFGGNPRNWTRKMRWMHTAVACFIAFVCTLASTILTPSQDPTIHTDSASAKAALPTSLYLFGLVFGPILSYLGSEALGRKLVYLVTLPLFAIFVTATAIVGGVAGFLACRFFSGLFCAPLLHLGFGTIFDIWTGSERSSALMLYIFSVLIGITLGPVIGGYIAEERGIEWTQYTVVILIVVCMMPMAFMKETAKEAINRRKKDSAKPVALSNEDCDTICLDPLRMLVTEPILVAGAAYGAYHLGVMYDICIALPTLLGRTYQFKPGVQGLSFVSMAIGVTMALSLLLAYQHWYYEPWVIRFKKEAASEDEKSLYSAHEPWRLQSTLSKLAPRSTASVSTWGSVFDSMPKSPGHSTHPPPSPGRRASIFDLLPRSAEQHQRSPSALGRSNSVLNSLKRMSSLRTKVEEQPQDDRHRNVTMAKAAATYLNGIDCNADKQISVERLLFVLEQNLEFQHFCTILDAWKINFDRFELARVLAEALAFHASPSTNLSMSTWTNQNSFRDIQHHRSATIKSLESASTLAAPVPTRAPSVAARRKTALPKTTPPPPEWRLRPSIPASILIVVSLFMLGWTTSSKIHWFVPLLAMSVFAASLLVVLVSIMQYLLESFEDERSVLAASNVLIWLLAFFFSLSAKDVLNLGAGPGMSVYGGISILLGTIPILLCFHGLRLRRGDGDRRPSTAR